MYTVYKITNSIDSRYYIGVHKTEYEMDSYLGSGLIIQRLISKYGKAHFAKEILYKTSNRNLAFKKEKEFIDLSDKNCLNISEGGQGGELFKGHKHSEETKSKIRQKVTGYKHTEEARKKIVAKNIGRKLSDETKQKLKERRVQYYSNINNRLKTSLSTKKGLQMKRGKVEAYLLGS